MNVELVSWEGFHRLARELALRILASGFAPDMIIAIARGGVVPARVLCDYLDIMDLACVGIEHYRARQKAPQARLKHPLNAPIDGRRILVVDDVCDTGDSFLAMLAHLEARGRPIEVRTCALQYKTVSKFVPDYYARTITEWRWVTYPWAAIEDLGALIESGGLAGEGRERIAQALHERHGIEAPLELIEDALQGLGRRPKG